MTPEEFGELIRIHREAKGLSIEELASRFKLSVSTVRGIEAGSLDRMPHVVYAKGFVRAYAQAVDVSSEDLDAGLASLFSDEMFSDVPTVPGPLSGAPRPERRSGNIAGVLFALIVLVLLGGGWFAFTHFDALKELVSRPLSAASSSAEPSAVEASQPRPETEAAPAPSGSAAGAPETPVTSAVPGSLGAPQEASPQISEPAEEVVVAPPAVAAPEVSSAPATVDSLIVSGKQVAIEAAEECWVQVSVDGGGTRTFSVFPGEVSVLPYKNRLTLVLGNTGGVSITHNGKAFPHNGKRNEKRTFTFQ